MMYRTIGNVLNNGLIRGSSPIRSFMVSRVVGAKNDDSTIDSFKLPSQTSINEWEFKYDFIPKVNEPKVPPVTPEAVKQDIANDKKASVEKELFNQELTSSIKVEANSAKVVHGGEFVSDEPEFLQDRGSKPIDVSHNNASNSNKPKKPVDREKYIQSSINPDINQSDVVSLSDNAVDHKVSEVDRPPVEDDIEHDKLHLGRDSHSEAPKSSGAGAGAGVLLALAGAGGAGYYFYSKDKSSDSK